MHSEWKPSKPATITCAVQEDVVFCAIFVEYVNRITITFRHVLFAQIVAQTRAKGSILQRIYNDKRAVCLGPARAGCHQSELLLASEVRIY